MSNNFKDKVVQFLVKAGKKSKILKYPIMCIMVVFLSVYHLFEKVCATVTRHKTAMRIVSSLVAVALVLTVMWPAFAEEDLSEPEVEVVEMTEEPSPSPSPEVTVEPLETEEPVETVAPEVEATMAPEEDVEVPEEGDLSDPAIVEEKEAGETEEPEEEKQNEVADTDSVKTDAKKVITASKKVKSGVSEARVVGDPRIVTQPQGISSGLTYGFEGEVKLSIEVEAADPSSDIVFYQWFCRKEGAAQATELTAVSETADSYKLDSSTPAGTYYYYCKVYSRDEKDKNNVSATITSEEAEIVVSKADPQKDYFNYSNVDTSYYYTGAARELAPTLKKAINGMGSYRYIFKVNDRLVTFKDPGTYDVWIRVEEGINYAARDIDLEQSVKISKIATPKNPYSISGTKGNFADNLQWYVSDVIISPAEGYTIGTSETGTFSETLVYSADGKNIGPDRIYLKNSSGYLTDPITVEEKINGELNIDQIKPVGAVTYGSNTMNEFLNTITFGTFFPETVSVTISATDATSGVDESKCGYYRSEEPLSQNQLSNVNWTPGTSYSETPESKHSQFIVYGKVVDKAGNVSYISSDGIVIDGEAPTITCDGSVPKESYIADVKHFEAADRSLSSVKISEGGIVQETLTVEDFTDGVAKFDLEGPEGASEDAREYTIVAEDRAGNKTTHTVSIANPVYDITVEDLDFGTGINAVVYGYESIPAQAINISQGSKATKEIVVDKIVVESGEFEVVSNDAVGGFKIQPKAKLPVGTYTGTVRIYYNGDDGSTTTFKCNLDVKKAILNVLYEGQTVYYHTIPDFAKHIIFKESDLKYDDTLEGIQKDSSYVAPVIRYEDANGITKPAIQTELLTPDQAVGGTSNYEFQYTGGTLNVVRRELKEGYEIIGVKGKNGWYTSATRIEPKAGYLLGLTENIEDFGVTPITVDTETTEQGETFSFYILNQATGEISLQMTEVIKIDMTAPALAEGDGITVSDNFWNSFINTITFGRYFNDTKTVEISGYDALSGLEGIYYYLSNNVTLTQEEVAALDDSAWTKYSSKFSLTPEALDHVVIYAKLTDKAGLSTYISSDGMIFDNKAPDIDDVVDGREYIVEEKEIIISDRNLTEATLYEGTDTTVGGTPLTIVDGSESRVTIKCPREGSKVYTIVAKDIVDNLSEESFTITKPIYDIEADNLVLGERTYGFIEDKAVEITWKNTEDANADATVTEVILDNTDNFQVIKKDNKYLLRPADGLHAGKYRSGMTLVYNDGKRAEATCSITVKKAMLTATYTGEDVYYYMEPDFESTLKVTGFAYGETPETAAAYFAPTIAFEGKATKTTVLTPANGDALDYDFTYVSGLLAVERRTAQMGEGGQYDIEGELSDTNWYISNIKIIPKPGFSVAFDEEAKEVAEQIILTTDTDNGRQSFYLVNNETGEIYEKTVFKYKKDSVVPEITGIEDGATYELNSTVATVKDEYLASVTVNGAAQEIVDGVAEITLSADQSTTVYVIVATDRAGNISNSSIVLKQPTELTEETPNNGTTPQPENPSNEDALENAAGNIRKSVKVIQGAPETVISTKTSKMAAAVLTGGEQLAVVNGSDADIELRIQNINGSVSQDDKELIIANLAGYSVGEYLDITLWKTVGSSSAKKVHTTKKPIAVTISIPEDMRKIAAATNRKFAIFRVHKNNVTLLEDQDSVANTITISTDRFSTYVLAYMDTKKATESKETKNVKLDSWLPDMGDHAPLIPVAAVLILAFVGIIIVIRTKKKQNNA